MQDIQEHTQSNIDEENEAAPIEIGQRVKINVLANDLKNAIDPEDYYYLKQFENKTGTITEKNKSKSGIWSYRVQFSENNFGYFYERDFTPIEIP